MILAPLVERGHVSAAFVSSKGGWRRRQARRMEGFQKSHVPRPLAPHITRETENNRFGKPAMHALADRGIGEAELTGEPWPWSLLSSFFSTFLRRSAWPWPGCPPPFRRQETVADG